MSKEKPALVKAAHWTADETQSELAYTSYTPIGPFSQQTLTGKDPLE